MENNNKQNIAIAEIKRDVSYIKEGQKRMEEGFKDFKLEMKSAIQNNRIYGEQRYVTKNEIKSTIEFVDKVKDRFFQASLGVFIFIGGIIVAVYYLVKNRLE